MRRRHLLTLTGAALAASPGCLARNRSGDDSATTSGDGGPGSQPEPSTSTTKIPDTPTPDRSEPPAYDCANASRPEPDPPDDEEAVQPVEYPEQPDSLADEEEVFEYVEAYEEAYLQNELVEEYGDGLVEHSLMMEDSRRFEAPDDVWIIRVQYTHGETIEEETEGLIYADSATISVTYYVDESVVIRAETDEYLEDEDEFKPNPWERGTLVECFE